MSLREPEFRIRSGRGQKSRNEFDLPEVQRQTEVFTDKKTQACQRFAKKGISRVSESSRKVGDINCFRYIGE